MQSSTEKKTPAPAAQGQQVVVRTVSRPGATLRVTAVTIPPQIQAAMAAAIRSESARSSSSGVAGD